MKILLTAVNAKYIHSNLAVYSIRANAGEYRDQIVLGEYTINQHTEDILQEIYKEQPDVLAFSCYIWNIRLVKELDTLRLIFSDNGKPYNPLDAKEPDITASAEDRAIGGLGIFMVRKMMDDVEYEYTKGMNKLTLTTKLQ